MSAPNNGFDVMLLLEWGLHDCLTLMELLRVLTSEWNGADSRVVEACRSGDCRCAAEEDSPLLRVVRACDDKLTAERASLGTGTDQAKV